MNNSFLPVDMDEARALGWHWVDFALACGDAYVDHPSFGAAIIGRVLQAAGYRVGMLPQPDYTDAKSFLRFGKPRLGVLISGGVVDSMVAHYTVARRRRHFDEYSPGGKTGLRPDRVVDVYARLAKQALPELPVIVGGVEASLRRFAHYDYWQDAVRPSVLETSGADYISFGMGERSIRQMADILATVPDAEARRAALCALPGVAYMAGLQALPTGYVECAAYAKVKADKTAYAKACAVQMNNQDPLTAKPLVQKQSEQYVVQNPPAMPLAQAELDAVYALPFTRRWHPVYDQPEGGLWRGYDAEKANSGAVMDAAAAAAVNALRGKAAKGAGKARAEVGAGGTDAADVTEAVADDLFEGEAHTAGQAKGIPGLEEVAFSIAHNRGCFGGCNFCAITMHQGRRVTSRSEQSVLAEAEALTKQPEFKGYIHDVGGPTANFRGPSCTWQLEHGMCGAGKRCLVPSPCPRLQVDHSEYLQILRRMRALPGVKKVFIRSGIRYDYLVHDKDERFFRELVAHHVSGQLKVAPEHCAPAVLAAMGKPPIGTYERFAKRFYALSKEAGKQQYLVPYLMSSHPGSTLRDAAALAEWLYDNHIRPEQVQDFYPTPGTVSTCMYYTGLDPFTLKEIYVARDGREKAMQRALLQYYLPQNAEVVRRALAQCGRADLIPKLLGKAAAKPQPQREGRRAAAAARQATQRGQHGGRSRDKQEKAPGKRGAKSPKKRK